MTLDELKAVLDSSGLPFAYHHWETRKEPPYGAYLYVSDRQFYADGALYFEQGHYQVELYSRRKDPGSERLVEAALGGAGIPCEKSEVYLEDQRLYEILYEIEV